VKTRTKVLLALGAVLAVPVVVFAYLGYVPGRQAYWDWKISGLCQKDGGVAILQQIRLSQADVERGVVPSFWKGGVGKGTRRLGIAAKGLEHPEAPVFAETKETALRDARPAVVRRETQVVRRSDSVVVARAVSYQRRGGDSPWSGADETVFSCPDPNVAQAGLHSLFIVQ
jgi:hypothetical protein